ncbi:aminotransferase class I/II-fold pyridoxal phosphate-dependent enzyme [Pelagicoccus sp. SDUM812003]|uniref:pyridoxal phosphate-dependent aminotransferase n=1 Tax=Pelagicoccus sp. SDUM812003 TaxID=3041267 RepID=UPI00280E0F60|nr:aminotransferase class I/II-fold pyridoxal phosphate-dependent enzyme [Pelagicoccus sp. SDUM812003]MDQ8203769.1 aminotransferase class I/II-fold pyridoxal phosphate-dependent enzyme [Pelagicoccus sp. SDUM812003]
MKRRDWLKNASIAAGAAAFSPRILSGQEGGAASSARDFVNLSINENQFGPSPRAIAAAQANAKFGHEYPLETQDQLKRLIAAREKVRPSQVILGAGSSDVLMGMSNALGGRGGNIVSSDPSFGPLMAWAAKFGVEHIKVPWTENGEVDLERIERSITDETQIAYICNPENPVGTVISKSELAAFCRRVSERCPVLVDEAYLDFAGDADQLGMMDCVREGLPVVVLRTFSKAYGLGGMRVGYAVTSEELASRISQYYVTGIGCGCSRVSLEAAIAAYEDRDWLSQVRQRTNANRTEFCRFLRERELAYFSSSTTFVLFPVPVDSQRIADAVYGGFRIKISPRNYYDRNYLRVSIGTRQQMRDLQNALSYVL